MLIEDDHSTLLLLQTLLEIEGFRVLVMDNMSDMDTILDTIRVDQPDLLLVDVHLRKISGLDLVRRIRADDEINSMRVLMTSGMEMSRECSLAGTNGFILKPFMPDDLVGMIQKLLLPSVGG